MVDTPVREVLIHNLMLDVHPFAAIRHNGTIEASDDAQLAVALHATSPAGSWVCRTWGVTLYYKRHEEQGAHAKPLCTFPKPLREIDIPPRWYPNLRELARASYDGKVTLWPAIAAGIAQNTAIDVRGLSSGRLEFSFHVGRRCFRYVEADYAVLGSIAALFRSTR